MGEPLSGLGDAPCPDPAPPPPPPSLTPGEARALLELLKRVELKWGEATAAVLLQQKLETIGRE